MEIPRARFETFFKVSEPELQVSIIERIRLVSTWPSAYPECCQSEIMNMTYSSWHFEPTRFGVTVYAVRRFQNRLPLFGRQALQSAPPQAGTESSVWNAGCLVGWFSWSPAFLAFLFFLACLAFLAFLAFLVFWFFLFSGCCFLSPCLPVLFFLVSGFFVSL